MGVKPATIYAYVSRGILQSYRQGMKRQRLYRRAEVEQLTRMAPKGRSARFARESTPSSTDLSSTMKR